MAQQQSTLAQNRVAFLSGRIGGQASILIGGVLIFSILLIGCAPEVTLKQTDKGSQILQVEDIKFQEVVLSLYWIENMPPDSVHLGVHPRGESFDPRPDSSLALHLNGRTFWPPLVGRDSVEMSQFVGSMGSNGMMTGGSITKTSHEQGLYLISTTTLESVAETSNLQVLLHLKSDAETETSSNKPVSTAEGSWDPLARSVGARKRIRTFLTKQNSLTNDQD